MMPAVIALIFMVLLPGATISQYGPAVANPDPNPEITAQKQPVPVKIGDDELILSAKSVYAIDRSSGEVLFEKDSGTARPIASITKLATAITIIQSKNLDDEVTVPTLPAYGPADQIIGLQAGEKYTVRELLSALLIHSANDAADALAIIDSGNKQAFSAKMNKLMDDWKIENTQFGNPSGLEDAENKAPAKAVAQLGILALHNKDLRKDVGTPSSSINSDQGRILQLATTDQLLQNGQFKGIKTGYTPAAGQCFVGLTTVQGHEIITVVLASDDRFGETQTLTDWIDRTYQWQ